MNPILSPPAPLSNPYTLVSVRAVPAPRGANGGHWHRYEISQGANRIIGYTEGGMESVTQAAEAMVVRLNARRLHERGRTHLTLGPRRQAG